MRRPGDSEEDISDYHSDEEQEEFEASKTDMLDNLAQVTERIQKLQLALDRADAQINQKNQQRQVVNSAYKDRIGVSGVSSKIGIRSNNKITSSRGKN